MLNTIRGWFKPELTDPADIRELNKTLDLQEINLDAMNGYEFAKDILLASDSVEIGKIHLNKIPVDPDFGKQFLVTAGTLWSNATTREENIGNKLDKGTGLIATNARVLEEQIENLFYVEGGDSTDGFFRKWNDGRLEMWGVINIESGLSNLLFTLPSNLKSYATNEELNINSHVGTQFWGNIPRKTGAWLRSSNSLEIYYDGSATKDPFFYKIEGKWK